jgi:hypothetical protein
MHLLQVAVPAVIVLYIVYRLAVRSKSGKKIVIASPSLGMLNLLGSAVADAMEKDKSHFSLLFCSIKESYRLVPKCDVLFLYADIDRVGQVKGHGGNLRDLIRESGARIVVVASDNPGPCYVTAEKPAKNAKANLVLTMKRKGPAFTSFFYRLFSEMLTGTTMPVAWNKLAPQIPGQIYANCPETIFSCELGQIAFK